MQAWLAPVRPAGAPSGTARAEGSPATAEAELPRAQRARETNRLDGTLAPVGRHAVVSGVVRTPSSEPVASETVQLRSAAPRARHSGVSDEAGGFSISGVPVGGVYDISVHPRGPYADYARRGIEVPAEGLELEVVLEPLPTRRLTGRIVDAEGRPVPGFRLWFRGDDAHKTAIGVRGDEAGRFEVDGAPLGRLRLAASGPGYVIQGEARIEAGAAGDLVVDAGEERVEGRVLNPRGEPVVGARLELSWTHRNSTQKVGSVRRGVSDESGGFRFTGLGPGPRRLAVSGAEEDALARTVDVAAGERAVEIVLDSSRPMQ